jgi:hypothetical protein
MPRSWKRTALPSGAHRPVDINKVLMFSQATNVEGFILQIDQRGSSAELTIHNNHDAH